MLLLLSTPVYPRIALALAVAACLVGMIVLRAESVPAATLAILNARVWTGNASQPWAQAVAVSGERILAVGTDEDIRKILQPATRVIDGNGATLTSGFIDAHFHLLEYKRPGKPVEHAVRGRQAGFCRSCREGSGQRP